MIYLCNRCDRLKDDDYIIGHQDPNNDTELVCENCLCDMEGDKNEIE